MYRREKSIRQKFRKIFAVSMSMILLGGIFPGTAFTSEAAEDYEHKLFFASDYQDDPAPDNLEEITKNIKEAGIEPELAVWCGDYITGLGWTDPTGEETVEEMMTNYNHIREVMTGRWSQLQYLFLQGNHDSTARVKDGTLTPTGAKEYEDYIVYTINKDDFPWVQGVDDKYTSSAESKAAVEKTASNLDTYLGKLIEEGCRKPVIIATHVPLSWSARSSSWSAGWLDNIYAGTLFDVINEAAEKLDILYLFGHNHSGNFDQYLGGTVNYLGVGDVMKVPDGTVGTHNYESRIINFTYLNAGYMGYTNRNLEPDISTATIMTIDEDSIKIEKYSTEGLYEPATKEIQRQQTRKPGSAIVSCTKDIEKRRIGETETLEFIESKVNPVAYKWSVDNAAEFVSAADQKTVELLYKKSGVTKIKCEVTYKNEAGQTKKLEREYTVSVLPEISQEELDAEVLAEFDFDDEENGLKGGLAVATGTYTLDNGTLYLNAEKENWLNVTKEDGSSLLTGQKEITVSMDVKRNRTKTNWAFYAAPHPYDQTIASEHYMGLLINDGITAECYNSLGMDRPGQAAVRNVTGEWMHLDIVYGEDATDVYMNGRLATHKQNDVAIDEMLGDNSVLWIGKAAWGSGEHFDGWLDNYRIVSRALTAEEIAEQQGVEPVIEARFDFDDAEGFEDDGAVASGTYSLAEHDGGKALSLNGSGQSLKVAGVAGNSVLSGRDEFSVAFQVKPDTSSATNWIFFVAPNSDRQIFQQERYIGIYGDKENKIRVERYNNTGTRPSHMTYQIPDEWTHIALVFKKGESIFYVNGEEVKRESSSYALTDILGNNSIINIGKAYWNDGEYYKGLIDNLVISGNAWTADEVKYEYENAGKELPEADKTMLVEAIKNAVPESDKDKYTADSWKAYENALSDAKRVNDKKKAKQAEVDAAVKALTDAKEALKAKDIVRDIFVDVNEGDWFEDYVQYIYDNKIMTGLDETHFAPADTLARAQFAIILYRMNGEPEVKYQAVFPDVTEGVWYTNAILWAAGTKVVNGYSDSGLFGPADNITREQMAVMMYRYANYKKYDVKKREPIAGFSDAGMVSPFAEEAMEWAVGNGIITGKDNGTRLDPQGSAARAECAAIIQRFMEQYE